jgi:hypothetical protein
MALTDRVAEAAEFAMLSAGKGFTIQEMADALGCSYTVADYTKDELERQLDGGAIQMFRDHIPGDGHAAHRFWLAFVAQPCATPTNRPGGRSS